MSHDKFVYCFVDYSDVKSQKCSQSLPVVHTRSNTGALTRCHGVDGSSDGSVRIGGYDTYIE